MNLYETPGAQRLIGAGTPGQSEFDAKRAVSDPLSTVFSPVVGTTVASKFVKPGDAFVDGLTASVAKGSERWRQSTNGQYRPVVTTGTLYGPFTTPPVEADKAPAGAPVVGTDTVTLDKGPGDYTSSGKLIADEAGYYTWVWSIDAADQDARTQTQIPKGYAFRDRFGQVQETHVSPSSVTAISHVADKEVPLSGELVDGIDVSVKDGAWIRDDQGDRVPVTFTGTAYHVPGDVAPAVSDTAPADAVVLGQRKLTATKPGTYTNADDPIEAPAAEGGFVSWVWQIRAEDQPTKYQGYVQDWSDSFGLPDETVHINVPQVSSLAKAKVAFGDEASDTGIIAGTMPAKPAQLTLEAFRQPEPGDRFKQPRTTIRTGQNTDLVDANAICTPGNRVFTTKDQPITVTTAGEYESAPVVFDKYGTYHWVETLTAANGDVIARGACGALGETTTIARTPHTPPTPTTPATPAAPATPTHGMPTGGDRELAFTGTTLPVLWIGGAAVLAAAIGLTIIALRRRNTTTQTTSDVDGIGQLLEE